MRHVIGTKVRRNGLDFKIVGYMPDTARYVLVPATTPITYVSTEALERGL